MGVLNKKFGCLSSLAILIGIGVLVAWLLSVIKSKNPYSVPPETSKRPSVADPGRSPDAPDANQNPIRPFTEKDVLFYVSGCERGEIIVRRVNLWLQPGGMIPGNIVIGIVSGEGRGRGKRKCRGSIVRKLAELEIEGRKWVRVDTIVGNYKAGWFTDTFVGETYNRKRCKKDFADYPSALTRCLPESPIPKTIKTAGGSFRVPGSGYVDGRDLQAKPRLTVMNINVWDNAPRSYSVCKVRHGTKVTLLESKRVSSENRYYVHIRSLKPDCEGWIPETFLNKMKHKPVGDRL